jgi:UDP-GlcNAc3NAcA epimerase
MKIVTVLGARPQFIKASVLSRTFLKDSDINEIIIHTGQHYDAEMSDIFFQEMQIPRPKYSLKRGGNLHGEMTSAMLEQIEKILIAENPDAVLVYGDTNSTLAGALAASKLHIPVAHVEAGLRSFNRKMPEEINRIIADQLADWLFTPTETAYVNLTNEGVDRKKIFKVGDIMFDSVLFNKKLAAAKSTILKELNLGNDPYVLVTIHRAENTDDPQRLHSIFEELEKVSNNKMVVLPLHPRTRALLKKDYTAQNFKIIRPVGYHDMLVLQQHCRLVVTDSGGIQKEAFFNNKFCITVRNETEWEELVRSQVNFLSNPVTTLSALVNDLWEKPANFDQMNFYGNGSTGDQIARILKEALA